MLDIPSQSGGYAVRQMIRFVFFMREPNLVIAPKIVKVIEELIDLFPPPQISSFAGPSGDWFEYDVAGLKQQVREGLIGKDKAINNNTNLAGDQANIPDFSIDYCGIAMDRPIFKNASSSLVFSIGASVFNNVKHIAIPLFKKIALHLNCSFAYVDIALEGNDLHTQNLAFQFLCIDISNVDCVERDMDDKIPGIFWKTYLNQSIVEQLGGVAILKEGLSNNTKMDVLQNKSIIITFGSEPILGDINHPEDYADRIWLAKLAHEKGLLHVPQKIRYFTTCEENIDILELQKQWHLRFIK